MIVYAFHDYEEAHVREVMDEMRIRGAPTIRCTPEDDALMAIEGVHRLEAARRLGLPVYVRVLPGDTPVAGLGLDWQDGDADATLSDMVAYTSSRSHRYSDVEVLP